MTQKNSWSFQQVIVASLLSGFVVIGLGLYLYTLAQYRDAVSERKALEQQYAEYQARQEKLQKYQADYTSKQLQYGIKK